ncbi:MAG: YDG domain-containing protein, partial [Sulfurimonas sp.]
FATKNVGTAKAITVTGNTITGTDAGNYELVQQAGLVANIIQKTLTITYGGTNKVYDGSTSVTVTTSDDRIAGDTFTLAHTDAFSNKNVGIGKTINITGVTLSNGDAANYTVASTSSTTANITQLSSVTWIGGVTGNWFDPANWAGGAVPDLSNVANVIIPTGVVVSFDTTGVVSPADVLGAVNIDSLGTLGSLTQTNGTLNIGSGGMSLNNYTQKGGTLSNGGTTILTSLIQNGGSFTGTGNITTGNLTQTGGSITTNGNLAVADGFSQGTSGSITVGGNTSISDSTVGIVIGNLTTTRDTMITSTGGDITQANGTVIIVGGDTTINANNGSANADITLDGNNNFIGAVNADGKNIILQDTIGGISIGNLTSSENTTINSTSGEIVQGAPSDIIISGITNLNAANGATKYDITLDSANNDFIGIFNADGQNITIKDKNTLTQGIITVAGMKNINTGDIPSTSSVTNDIMTNIHNASILNTLPVLSVSSPGTLASVNQPSSISQMQEPFQAIFSSNAMDSGSYTIVGIVTDDKMYKMITMDEIRKSFPKDQEIRIPVSNNNGITLVSGGVHLPDGIGQEFYVVDNNTKKEKNN